MSTIAPARVRTADRRARHRQLSAPTSEWWPGIDHSPAGGTQAGGDAENISAKLRIGEGARPRSSQRAAAAWVDSRGVAPTRRRAFRMRTRGNRAKL